MEETTAVQKPAMVNPGTIVEASHNKNTLIRNAKRPKVKIEIGRAIICKIGFRSELIIPITIAATTNAV